MAHEKNWIPNGVYSLEGGIDSGNSPSIIQPNQCAFACNATMRGGFVQNRPGFPHPTLTFFRKAFVDSSGEPDEITAAQVQVNFRTGRFQGSKEYKYPGGVCIIASISGRIYRINVSTDFSVTDISIEGDLNPDIRDFIKMQQADRWLIIQDGQSVPLIYNGATLRRSNLQIPEVPVGDSMAYVMGRLWVGRGKQYVAGDLYGTPSPTTTPAIGNADAVLKFTENQYIAEGGSFGIPTDGEGITGMIPIATPNTILGQGPLLIATPDSIFANDVPIDRTLWKDLQYPIQTIQSILNGATSQESMVQVNSDIWYRSPDGIRSFIQGLRDFHTPGNTPQSHEMLRITALEDQRLLPWVSGANFDNRLLMTAWPQRDQDHGVWFKGLHVLNFDGVSGLGRKTPPCWEGIWTGLRFLRLVPCTVNSEKRLFAFVLDQNDEIDLWEISKNEDFDDGDKRIEWWIESRQFNFGDSTAFKKLEASEFWIDNLVGTADFDLKFKSDEYACWFDWANIQRCAKEKWCPSDDPLTCKTIKEFKPGYSPQIEISSPPDTCIPGVQRPASNGFTFMFYIGVTGACRIKLFTGYASPQQDVSFPEC